MALRKIACLGHPLLRESAEPITPAELRARSTQTLIEDAIETMRDADGASISAPQIHVSKQIILVEVNPVNPRYADKPAVPLTVIANPRVISHGDELEDGWEECLSLPNLHGRVPRWTRLTAAGVDRDGNVMEIEAEGFFARLIQHAIDHLHGHLFVDRIPDLITLTYQHEYQKYWRKERAGSVRLRRG